jgi:N-sulfoglucosamine sulfohydrolase
MRLQLCCVLAIIGFSVGAPTGRAADRPLNLLYITADDMNWDSSGWMGSKLGATPALDGLAAQSHRFIHHHVTAPICMPSREAMMTGRVPHRSGGLGFIPIRAGTPTMVSTLKTAGYYTAVINKVAHMKPDTEFPWNDSFTGSGKNPPLLREHFETTLKNAATTNKPFFINVNIQDPHRPFPGSAGADSAGEDGAGAKPRGNRAAGTPRKAAKLAGAKTDGLERIYKPDEIIVPPFLEDIPPVREEVAQYFTGVARFDVALAGILEALAESGHADDTIVFFVSDHGMSFPFSKATVYYNGTRSPALLKYPGMPPVTTHEELVSSVDIMPTLLDLLSVVQPSGMDGRSWLPLLRGEKQEARDYVITHVNTVSSGASFPQRCVRTKNRALIFHAWPDGSEKFRVEAMSGITFKALTDTGRSNEHIGARVRQLRVGEPLMFFDESVDPGERTNLINVVESRQEVEQLAAILLAHMEKTDDPQTASFKTALAAWRRGDGTR